LKYISIRKKKKIEEKSKEKGGAPFAENVIKILSN